MSTFLQGDITGQIDEVAGTAAVSTAQTTANTALTNSASAQTSANAANANANTRLLNLNSSATNFNMSISNAGYANLVTVNQSGNGGVIVLVCGTWNNGTSLNVIPTLRLVDLNGTAITPDITTSSSSGSIMTNSFSLVAFSTTQGAILQGHTGGGASIAIIGRITCVGGLPS